LLHGLMRSSDSMETLVKAFDSRGDMRPVTFTYASTQASIDDHAAALREWVDNLPGHPRLSFVGHSLGNIVLRRTVAMWQRDGDPEQVLPRMHRVVMLGPPNQGSSIARQLARLGLFEKITGTSGQELGLVWNDLQEKLGTPACPFCIVAGDLSEGSLQNPLIAGKSDFVVTLDETKLDGAAENIIVPVLHSFLMSDSRVIDATLKFIEPLPPAQRPE
jgi:pimeloyl-ACP methyl ester carboxylesterase